MERPVKTVGKINLNLIVYIGYILTFFLFTYFAHARFGDDAVLAEQYANANIINEVINRYFNWSSRVVIDAVMIFMATHRLLYWKVVNFIVFSTMPFYLSGIFTDFSRKTNGLKGSKIGWLDDIRKVVFQDNKASLMALVLIASYPMLDMASCGWISCTMNYMWPLWCLIVMGYLIKKRLCSEKVYLFEWIIGLLAAIFGCSHELTAVYAFALFMTAICYSKLKGKSLGAFVYILFALNTIELISIVLSPANGSRTLKEAEIYMPEFLDFTIFDKIHLGILNTMNLFVMHFNILFIIFGIILVICTYLKDESLIDTFIAMIPVGVSIGYILGLSSISENYIGYAGHALSFIWRDTKSLPVAFFFLIILSIVYSFYRLFKDKYDFLLALIISAVGMATSVVMGFSPTMYASENRPYIYLNFTIIFLIIYCIKKSEMEKNLSLLIFAVILTYAIGNSLATIQMGILA